MTDTLERREAIARVKAALADADNIDSIGVMVKSADLHAILALSLPAREVSGEREVLSNFASMVGVWLEQGPNAQPHYVRDGKPHCRPWSTGDLKALHSALAALATTPAPREMDLVEASSLRSTVRDIAESEAIPTAAEAYEWCRDLARATLAKLDRSAEEG